MEAIDELCIWITELVPFAAALAAFLFGIKNFFKKGKALYLQSITMAMGCHALASMYHICLTLTNTRLFDGFTPAYLGKTGFFLFLIAASYGQLDRIVDDGSRELRKNRITALIAPLFAVLLYLPNGLMEDVPASTKITYFLVWVPATISLYFNLKHAIIPDLDFGFIKAIRPYNILAVALGFSELLCLTAWDYYYPVLMALSGILFGVLCIATMYAAKRGVEKWTI